MSTELIPIIALVVMFVAATRAAGEHGRTGLRRRLRRRHRLGGYEHRRHHRRIPRRLFLTLVGVTYLFAIAQNNGTVDLMVRGPFASSGPGRPHPVGDVRHHRSPHRDRGARARGRRDHRADRARLRRAVQDQRAADGHDGDSRRAGRWLLPDQHLRRHRQLHHRQGRPRRQPPGVVPRQPLLQRGDRRAAVRLPRRKDTDRPTRRRP